MAERRGMGRGLAAILPEPSAGGPELLEVEIGLIDPNPDQPRSTFEPEALDSLASSIASAGLLQPLIVRPSPSEGRYELVAGERRLRAAAKAGLDRVPVVVRASPEDERLQAALIENVVREDLDPVDEARACAALVDDLGISKEELASRLGRSRASISNLIRILDLPDAALEMVSQGRLSEGHARAILREPDQTKRLRLAREAAKQEWSVRETERRASPQKRERPANRRSGGRISATDRAAFEEAGEELEAAIGHEVHVRRAGKRIRADLDFADLDELRALARRICRRR